MTKRRIIKMAQNLKIEGKPISLEDLVRVVVKDIMKENSGYSQTNLLRETKRPYFLKIYEEILPLF